VREEVGRAVSEVTATRGAGPEFGR
jgi:hypothetical protein